MRFRTDAAQPAILDGGMACRVDDEVVIGVQFRLARAEQLLVRLLERVDAGQPIDGAVFVAQDMLPPVVLDMGLHVLFRMEVDLLRAGLVFDTQLVEAARAFRARGGHASEDGAGLVPRQLIGGHGFGIVHPADDERLIGVAFQKGNDDLLSDARPGPALGHAKPAACMLVALALSVPEKLHLYPPVGVRMDLLAGGAGDDGRLVARHQSLGVDDLGDKAGRLRDGRQAGRIGHAAVGRFAAQHLRLLPPAGNADDPPFGVDVFPVVAMQRKRMPRQKAGNIRLGLDARLERELPCELDAGIAPHLFRARAKDGIAIGFAGDARRAGSLCGVPGLDVLFPYGHAGEKIPVAQGGLTAEAPGTKHQPGYDGGIRRLT